MCGNRRLHVSTMIVAAWLFAPVSLFGQTDGDAEGQPEEKEKKPLPEKGRSKRGMGFRRPIDAPRPGVRDEQQSPMGGRRGGFRGGDIPPLPVLSEEELQHLHDFVKQHFPEQYERMKRPWQDDPASRQRIASRIWPKLSQVILAYRRNPELGTLMIQDQKIEEEVRKKVHAYRDASEDRRKEIEQEVRSLMSEQFDIRQKRRALEIAELEKRLAEQKRMLEERSANKDAIIRREIDRRIHPELEF